MIKFSQRVVCFITLALPIGALAQGGGTGTTTGTTRLVGFIGSLPAAGGQIGTWTVAGLPVTVNNSTNFNSSGGSVIAGSCVEIIGTPGTGSGSGSTATWTATQVTTLPSSRCGAGTGDVTALEYTGPLGSFPTTGSSGTWSIGGQNFIATNSTTINQFAGPALTGSCVRVGGNSNTSGGTGGSTVLNANQIVVIGGVNGCNFASSATPQNVSFRGLVQQISQLGGLLTIGGRTVNFASNANTTPAGYRGIQGDCVDIAGTIDNTGLVTASTVQQLPATSCAFTSTQQDPFRFTGTITSIPSQPGTGNWTVGGYTVIPSSSTVLGNNLGEFTTGTCVEVSGNLSTTATNTVNAQRVRTLPASACTGLNANNNTSFYGVVTQAPTSSGTGGGSSQGQYLVAGRLVNVGSSTGVSTQYGQLGLGSCVLVQGAPGTGGSGSGTDVFNATQVTVQAAGGSCVFNGGVVSTASYAGNAVSPGQIISILGSNVGTFNTASLTVTNNVVNSVLSGVRVYFDGEAAPILMTSRNQVNVVVPCSVAGKSTTTVQVSNNGVVTNTIVMPVNTGQPSIFTTNMSGTGGGAILNFNQTTNVYTVNASNNQAAPGSIISIYFTGAGATTPACSTGAVTPSVLSQVPRINGPVTVTFGTGTNAVQGEVLYAGAAPGSVYGLFQANVRIPNNAPTGANVPVFINVGGQPSQQGVTISIGTGTGTGTGTGSGEPPSGQ